MMVVTTQLLLQNRLQVPLHGSHVVAQNYTPAGPPDVLAWWIAGGAGRTGGGGGRLLPSGLPTTDPFTPHLLEPP